jgi:hypothetical protein
VTPARASVLAVALLATATVAAQPGAPRLVAVADIHGDMGAFTAILRAANLVDAQGRWSGGRARFVQTGDYTDRGPDVRAIFDMLRGLEDSARKAGGRAEVLLGNHEVMNLVGIYRDVNPAVYASFADAQSEERRERAWDEHRRLSERMAGAFKTLPPVYDASDRARWMAAHPPGFLEHAAALAPNGSYGRWLRGKAIAIDVDGTILMHAGLDPASAPESVEALNRQVRDAIRRHDQARQYLVDRRIILPFFTFDEALAAVVAEAEAIQAGQRDQIDQRHLDMLQVIFGLLKSPLLAEHGPLWFRGFATWTDAEGAAQVGALLDRYRASRFVTGHTVQKAVTSRFGHRLFLIDTGMLAAVYKGQPSALEIDGGTITAITPSGREVLHTMSDHRVPAAAR